MDVILHIAKREIEKRQSLEKSIVVLRWSLRASYTALLQNK